MIIRRWSAGRTARLLLACAVAGIATLAVSAPAQAHPDIAFASADASQNADGSVTVAWTITGTDPALTGFSIERRVTGTAPVMLASVGAAARSTVDDLSGLAPGVYTVVYRIATIGASPSATVDTPEITIYQEVPGPPDGVDITTDNNQVALRWYPPIINADLLDGYRLVRVFASVTTVLGTFPASRTTYTDTVPVSTPGIYGVEYHIISMRGVVALNGVVEGGQLDFPVTIYVGVPSFPETVSARMGFDGESAVVTWTPPTENANLVTGYRIVRSFGGSDVVLGTVGSTPRELVDPQLPAGAGDGAEVTYLVTALWSGGDGGFQAGILTVDRAPLAMPTPTVTAHDTALGVSWPAPETIGVAGRVSATAVTVTSYRVRFRVVGFSVWSLVPAGDVDSPARTAGVDGLTNGVSYEVQVAAVDVAGAGQSLWSSSATGTPTGPVIPVTGLTGASPLAGLGSSLLLLGVVLRCAPWRRTSRPNTGRELILIDGASSK